MVEEMSVNKYQELLVMYADRDADQREVINDLISALGSSLKIQNEIWERCCITLAKSDKAFREAWNKEGGINGHSTETLSNKVDRTVEKLAENLRR